MFLSRKETYLRSIVLVSFHVQIALLYVTVAYRRMLTEDGHSPLGFCICHWSGGREMNEMGEGK